jgi:hypothetical protein
MQRLNSKYNLASSLYLQLGDIDKKAFIKNIIEAENKLDPKYKTELCKKFQNTGQCPYGYKCRFAHGKDELISKNQGKNYKKRLCKSFYEKGYCPYGSRCNFRHFEKSLSEINISYYYFQLFLLKKYYNRSSENFLHSIGSNLINDRLPVFKSLLKNLSGNKNIKLDKFYESSKGDLFETKCERKFSQSTVSNTSYEEDKKSSINFNEINSNNLNRINNFQ